MTRRQYLGDVVGGVAIAFPLARLEAPLWVWCSVILGIAILILNGPAFGRAERKREE